MRQCGLLLGFLALLLLVLPSLSAQDDKKKADPEKAEKKADAEDKKDPDKKDPEKKDPEKKDPEKKDEEKKKPEPKKAPEKLVYGSKIGPVKILSANAASNREYTVEIQEIDPKKVYDLQVWQTQQQFSLQQQLNGISTQKNPQQRLTQMQSYQRALYNYQMESTKRSQNIYTPKAFDVQAAQDVKVRAMFPPVEFDDQGFEKKWTKKELAARRDKTGLPGFPVDLDALKTGQYVELYMAKVAPAAKGPKKKRNPDDDPPPAADRPEFVMIVIVAESKK